MRVSLFNRLFIYTFFSLVLCFAQEKVDYKTPLSFEENVGQKDARVQFSAHGQGFALFLTKDSMVFDFARKIQDETDNDPKKMSLDQLNPRERDKPAKMQHEALFVEFLGMNNNIEVVGEDMLPGKSNYFIGNDHEKWHTDINQYSKIRYKNIYPGIDLLYYSINGLIEYDFILSPGADPNQIKLQYKGAKSLNTDDQGNLLIEMGFGIVSHKAPVIYQESNQKRSSINGSYIVSENNQISFNIKNYDQSKALIIDPVLGFSTLFGGSVNDYGNAITLDNSGNIYISGLTTSSDFPTLTPYQTDQGGYDTYVLKLNSDGNTIIYSTYLGGSDNEYSNSIDIDSNGNVAIAGVTRSTDYPTLNANQTYIGPQYVDDIFVTKLNSSGNALIFSTYLAGTSYDICSGLAIDSTGNVYVTGHTFSTDFPTLNPFQTHQGVGDAFVTKFDGSGNLAYSTYLGGATEGDRGTCIAVDSAGNAYIGGYTASTDFPTLNPYQAYLGNVDVFISKLNSSGSALLYSTYLGGTDSEESTDISVDSSGNAYITGFTNSGDYPLENPIQPFRGTSFSKDMFVTKLSSSGSALVYSTYLGGTLEDEAFDIEIDSAGHAFIMGTTDSTDLPLINAYSSKQFRTDISLSKLSTDGKSLIYSTYLGGTDHDYANAIALDAAGNVFITGYSYSTDFPLSNPNFGNSGGREAFLTKMVAYDDVSFVVSGITDPIIAGNTSDITIRVQDSLGHTIFGYDREIMFKGNNTTFSSPTYTFTLGDSGIHTISNNVTFYSPGEHTITAYDFNYTAITGSQTAITVLSAAGIPANSSAIVPAGNVGETTSISISINDVLGNPVQAGDDLIITIGGSNAGIFAGVSNTSTGNYSATYTPMHFGNDTVSITLGGIHIPGSPFTSLVSGVATNIIANVPNGNVGEVTNISLQINNSIGNPVSSIPGDFQITVSGANNGVSVGLTNNGNGSYTAQYNPLNFGTDLIAITFAGVAIPGSPFSSFISSITPGINASVPDGKVDTTTTIALQINDSFGNPVANATGDFAISISGANSESFVGITGYGNGRYVAQYNPLNFGADLISISFAGTAIPGSPFTSIVSSLNPELAITGTNSGSIGQTLHFTATGFDDSTSPDMQWDFGDGAGFQSKSYTSEHALSHVYTEAGTYTLTVEARDNEGQKTSASMALTISELDIDQVLAYFSAQRINPLDILLSWSGGNDDLAELVGYELYYSLLDSSKSDDLTLIKSTTNSSLIVNGFDANLGYRFSVVPVYAGNIKGDTLTCDLTALLPTESMPTYHLRFPHVAQNDQWWTGIVVVNPNANSSSIQFNAIDQDGNSLPQSKALNSLAGGEKIVGLVSDYFSEETLEQASWLDLQSDSKLIGFELFGQGSDNMSGILVNGQLIDNGTLPIAEDKSGRYVALSLINISNDNSSLELNGFSTSGDLIAEQSMDIPSMGKMATTIKDLFADNWNEEITSLNFNATQPLVGFELWGDSQYWSYQNGLQIPQNGSLNSILPIVESGSIITLQNTAAVANTITLEAYDNSGKLVKTIELELKANQSKSYNSDEILDYGFSGSLELQANATFIALTELKRYRHDGILAEAITAQNESGKEFLFPHIASNEQWSTEIILINTGDRNEGIRLIAFNDHGVELRSVTPTINKQGRLHSKISDLFDQTDDIAYIRAVSYGQPFIGHMIYYTNSGYGHLMGGTVVKPLD